MTKDELESDEKKTFQASFETPNELKLRKHHPLLYGSYTSSYADAVYEEICIFFTSKQIGLSINMFCYTGILRFTFCAVFLVKPENPEERKLPQQQL